MGYSSKQKAVAIQNWARKRETHRSFLLSLKPDIDGVVSIPLTRGQYALVDFGDVQLIARHRWHSQPGGKTFYAAAWVVRPDGSKFHLWMHRVILGLPEEFECDHRDGNGLNNRRENLRRATTQENRRNVGLRRDNTSGFKGVQRQNGKWVPRIAVDGKQRHLGYFSTPEDAHAAYCRAASALHGEFARVS